ncbi:alpha/beta-hydrolase, putative [Plasmodium gallinaceum]|uniref:Alpha/beta-hydrolase, putative n=1 Tax=Plasmodium gallinaceum TaxID=5849 RepID=A0A1J1GVD8_PLAGA|nr:alpha/beta-hydrolase, putative [Plasmodium gallinaceum]CRG95011.1 alpha/beta-hydrolase, putative [Plasmodium gallinaceum]
MLYESKIECKKNLKDVCENNYNGELMKKSDELMNLIKNENEINSNEEIIIENNSNYQNEHNKKLINCDSLNVNDKLNLECSLSKEDDETIKNSKEESKNRNNEERHIEDNYLKYDDGNPEINFFINKDNLKIARYAWKAKNPKAYIFALHGITSHLRNEYLNFLGRPKWVDEKINEKKEKKNKENENENEKNENEKNENEKNENEKNENEKNENGNEKKENENVFEEELLKDKIINKNINSEEINCINEICNNCKYENNTNQNTKKSNDSIKTSPDNTYEKNDFYTVNINYESTRSNISNNNLNWNEDNEQNEIKYNNGKSDEKKNDVELEMNENNYISNNNKIDVNNVVDPKEKDISIFCNKSNFFKKKESKEKMQSSISSNNTSYSLKNYINNRKKKKKEEKEKNKLNSNFFNDCANENTEENVQTKKFSYDSNSENKKDSSILEAQSLSKDKKKNFRYSSAEGFGFSIYKMKKKGSKKETKSICETNSLDGEPNNSDTSFCSSSEVINKRNLEKKLTMFLSCSSCVSSFIEDTHTLNDRITSESSCNEFPTNKVVDDDNVLLVDKNETGKPYDSNVYYCSMCGICEYCNCGNRSISYKNSWIEKLNQNNFSFFGIDNQSHGLSEGWQNQRCYVDDFDNFIIDAIQALEILINEWKEKNELKPIIIMGLSMGGCIALRTLETIFKLNKEWKNYIKTLVLISPMICLGKQKSKITNRLLFSASKFLKYFFPRLKVNVKESNALYPWLKYDSQIDPLHYCGPLKIKIAAECVSAADNCLDYSILKYVEESDVDIIIIQSKYDCIVDPSGTINFMKKMVRLCKKKGEKLKENIKENIKYSQERSFNTKEEKEDEMNNKKIYNDDEVTSNIEKNEDISNIRINNNCSNENNDISKIYDKTENEINYNHEIISDYLTNNWESDNKIYANINFNEEIEKEKKLTYDDLTEISKKTDLQLMSRKTLNYSDIMYNYDEKYSLPVKNKMEIWNSFDHGFYKHIKLKKNTKSKNDFSSDEEKFKNLTIYILKYGCHTLPVEPNTKETANILVDWLNNIHE